MSVFTGDTLFAGDVGRPDLRDAEEKPTRLAAAFTIRCSRNCSGCRRTEVYPAHGAGSLCGRKISSAPFTTIGQERFSIGRCKSKTAMSSFAKWPRTCRIVRNISRMTFRINLHGAPLLSSFQHCVFWRRQTWTRRSSPGNSRH